MSERDNYFTGTPADFRFEGPSDEVLRQTIEHENGDLTLRGPGGELHLTKGTATWKRYRRYLDDLDEPYITCHDSVGPKTWEEAKARGLDKSLGVRPEDFDK